MLNLSNIQLYNNNNLLNDDNHEIIKSKISISEIENSIHSILDKFDDKCKYYFDLNNNFWLVSFKVDIDQLDAMIQTMFEIYLFKDENDRSIIIISNEINSHHEWSDVLKSLKKNLKN